MSLPQQPDMPYNRPRNKSHTGNQVFNLLNGPSEPLRSPIRIPPLPPSARPAVSNSSPASTEDVFLHVHTEMELLNSTLGRSIASLKSEIGRREAEMIPGAEGAFEGA
ncbi:hypothetical protein GLAREA_09609 [Glarea lozoyensis ATCC 20868]|uniref:Uncharacterized protein n=1 Tax=Glarea lozoyensis (strain ATCC 20868 / MF5171) TaxID=1116229 RepID=S3DPU1_GLAL2|nr:uncharacterized protein GLAREA_09609 [Glarea lozoyensis ATCC 20868]EPE28488.1 hypothetical protein GLAREA_09609 [Glarea lozoyensis ATCC 20868]